MRVLILTDWPRVPAGTERYVETIYEALLADGDEAELMCSSVGSGAGGRARFIAGSSERAAAQALLQIANPSAWRTLRQALVEFRPDVVHLAMFLPYMSPLVLAPLHSTPATMMAVDFKPVCPVGTKMLPDGSQCRDPAGRACFVNGCLGAARAAREAVRYGAFRAGLANVDRVFACSDHVARELGHVGIDARWLPLASPSPPAAVRDPDPDPLFVYAGRLAEVKGLYELLDAFAGLRRRHPAARLQVYGEGVLRGELLNRSRRLGLAGAVRFSASMSDTWTEALRSAWALVAPSTYREPLGLVAVEAIARGVPVVASREGGFGETVEDGVSGLLFDNGDTGALQACLETICRGEGPGPVLGDAATATVRARHNVATHLQELRTAWQEIGA